MKNNRTRLIAMLAAIVCSMMFIGAASASIMNTYTVSDNMFVDAVGWYFNNDVMLMLNDDGTYTLMFKQDIFGTTDPGIKGNKTTFFEGKYTSAPSADEEVSHLDITLDTTDRVYLEQHGKAFGRQVLNFSMVLDTANWTEDMTYIAFPAGSDDPVADFLANHSVTGMMLTVEDLQLDMDDVTLVNRILEMPDLTVLNIAE